MNKQNSCPKRGDIIVIDFDPQARCEIKKRRPALVISDTKFNLMGLCVVCTITSTKPKHSFHIPLPIGLQTHGAVKTEQIKSLDYNARNFKIVESTGAAFTLKVRQIVAAFL